MSDIISINVGETWRRRSLVAKADGSAITSGTGNYYLKALTGANAGKWYRNSDSTWQASETANAMTHQADGSWTINLTDSPFADGVVYVEYAKESGDLHVAGEGQLLRGSDSAAATRSAVGLASADLDTQLSDISTAVTTLDVANSPHQGVAFALQFPMSLDRVLKTGLTVTGMVRHPGDPSFTALTNAVTEAGYGFYEVTLTAAEMDAANVAVIFSATGADSRSYLLVTQ